MAGHTARDKDSRPVFFHAERQLDILHRLDYRERALECPAPEKHHLIPNANARGNEPDPVQHRRNRFRRRLSPESSYVAPKHPPTALSFSRSALSMREIAPGKSLASAWSRTITSFCAALMPLLICVPLNNFNRTIPDVYGLDAPGNILRFIVRQYDNGNALSRRKPGRPVLAVFPETPDARQQ